MGSPYRHRPQRNPCDSVRTGAEAAPIPIPIRDNYIATFWMSVTGYVKQPETDADTHRATEPGPRCAS
jgi:hypothetical protein